MYCTCFFFSNQVVRNWMLLDNVRPFSRHVLGDRIIVANVKLGAGDTLERPTTTRRVTVDRALRQSWDLSILCICVCFYMGNCAVKSSVYCWSSVERMISLKSDIIPIILLAENVLCNNFVGIM